MHVRCPKHPRCRRLHQVGPARATLLALLMAVVAFAPPLTPQAEASSNPGVTFSTGLLEVEEGGTNQYTVVLDSEPASCTGHRGWKLRDGVSLLCECGLSTTNTNTGSLMAHAC